MSISIKQISLEEENENDYITLSELMCKGIFDPKLPISKFFKDYELGDEILEKTTHILKNLNDNFKLDSSEYNFILNLLVTLFYKLKGNIVELVERIGMADQALVYRDMVIKEKDEKQFRQIKFFTDKIKKLEEENKIVKEKEKEINKLSSSISSLSLRNIEHEENADTFNKKIKNLQNEINSTKSKFQKEINDLKNELSKQYSIVEKQQKTIDANKGIENKCKVLEKNLKEQIDSVKSFNEQKFEFEEIEKLKNSLNKENINLKTELKSLSEKNIVLEKQIEQTKQQNSESVVQINKLSKIIEQNNIIISSAKDSNKTNEKLINDKNLIIKELEKEITKLKKDFGELEENNHKEKENVKELKQSFDELEQNNDKNKKHIEELKQQIQDLLSKQKSQEIALNQKNKYNKRNQNMKNNHQTQQMQQIQHMQHIQHMQYVQHMQHVQNMQEMHQIQDVQEQTNCDQGSCVGQNPMIYYVPVPVPSIPPFPMLPCEQGFTSYYPPNPYQQCENLDNSSTECEN